MQTEDENKVYNCMTDYHESTKACKWFELQKPLIRRPQSLTLEWINHLIRVKGKFQKLNVKICQGDWENERHSISDMTIAEYMILSMVD